MERTERYRGTTEIVYGGKKRDWWFRYTVLSLVFYLVYAVVSIFVSWQNTHFVWVIVGLLLFYITMFAVVMILSKKLKDRDKKLVVLSYYRQAINILKKVFGIVNIVMTFFIALDGYHGSKTMQGLSIAIVVILLVRLVIKIFISIYKIARRKKNYLYKKDRQQEIQKKYDEELLDIEHEFQLLDRRKEDLERRKRSLYHQQNHGDSEETVHETV